MPGKYCNTFYLAIRGTAQVLIVERRAFSAYSDIAIKVSCKVEEENTNKENDGHRSLYRKLLRSNYRNGGLSLTDLYVFLINPDVFLLESNCIKSKSNSWHTTE